MRLRTLAAAGTACAAVVLGGLYAWTSPVPIAPAAAPPSPPSAAVLAAGARVVALGDCMVCHTAPDGPAYAGGLGLRTPFGIIYSTNITPDPDTGIGRWTGAAFRRALREGVARDGHLLYPAFPYIHYTRMSDEDIELAYAYLMSRPPVRVKQPANDLVFPLNFRPLLAFWNALYLRPGDGAPSPAGQVGRGRYLVDTLGHCASCHSGMNVMGGERSPPFQGGTVDGWHAPALTRLAQGSAPWTRAELTDYLRGGLSLAHGAAKGPMRPVTERLAGVPREDVEAMAAYLMTIQQPGPAPAAAVPVAARADTSGAALFAAACAGCHAPAAPMMRLGDRPGLARSSAVLGDDPANFIQTVLHGIPWERTAPGGAAPAYMPPFADVLSDAQVAELAAWVRAGTGLPAWPDVAAASGKLRKEIQP
jgi:mono/diheme cytochrome c family protein